IFPKQQQQQRAVMHSVPLWIFLIVIAHGKATYGIVVNSFNGLTVGSGQLNGIGNEVYVADVFNGPQNFRPKSRSSLSRSAPAPSSTFINSFQGNVVGSNSLQNNAGISLVPGRVISTGNFSRQIDEQLELFRRRVRLWVAELRARYRLFYSLYPYAFIYMN
ncbi:unnamed protein product, partial [Litomosoides sigmodontis]